MLSFQGKKVLVTGGSRGIGGEIVKLFAELGADVAFNYIANKNAANKILQQLASFKGNYFTQKCEISDFDQVKDFVENTIQKLGDIDILVNNAGIWEEAAIEKMSNREWQRMMHINLDSVFYFSKLVTEHFKKENKPGKIINIASTAGQRGEAFHSHYAASKGAIISFTKSLATELGPFGISVNCVAPGWVRTDMAKDALLTEEKEVIAEIPLGKIPDAHEIAGPVVFLASEWASAINGEILNVNGGSVLCG